MGALCSCCRGGGVLEDGHVEMSQQQGKTGQPAQQRRKPTSKSETAEDRAKAEEAKRQAGLAAQRREEAFDKSAAGRAARKVAADLAKPAQPPNRGEPALRWQMG
ncbi:unnamed protein product [Calypogeia fissa]